jgi:hypothetical protein
MTRIGWIKKINLDNKILTAKHSLIPLVGWTQIYSAKQNKKSVLIRFTRVIRVQIFLIVYSVSKNPHSFLKVSSSFPSNFIPS